MKRLTISATEATRVLREMGMHISEKRLVDEIARGDVWPFGRVVNTGKSGRRTVVIMRREFEDAMERLRPREAETPAASN